MTKLDELIVPQHRSHADDLADQCKDLRERCDWLERQIEAIRHFANVQPSATWAALAQDLDEANRRHLG